MDSKEKLTSIKIDKELYNSFQELKKQNNLSFHKLAERSIHLYLNDEKYRSMLNSYIEYDILKKMKNI